MQWRQRPPYRPRRVAGRRAGLNEIQPVEEDCYAVEAQESVARFFLHWKQAGSACRRHRTKKMPRVNAKMDMAKNANNSFLSAEFRLRAPVVSLFIVTVSCSARILFDDDLALHLAVTHSAINRAIHHEFPGVRECHDHSHQCLCRAPHNVSGGAGVNACAVVDVH